MSLTVKALMSVSILVYTVICGYFAYKATVMEWKQMNEINDLLRQIN